MKKWILEIFRAGKQTDSSGNSREWTEADLDKIVSQYEASEHEAPIVIGHPKTDDPAFGWIDRVFREGKTLFAEVTEVAKEFREAVNQGFYKKRSISLYPDLTLKHVGFLGAVPPAVKGLADIKFNAADSAICFEVAPEQGSEFSDYETAFGFRSVGRLLRNLREYLIADKGQEIADRVVPNWEIRGLENFKDPEPEEKDDDRPSFNENHSPEGEPMTEQEKKEFEALQAKVASFSETEKALEAKTAEAEAEKARADAAEAKLAETEKAAAEASEAAAAEEVKAFAESLVASGKIPAAELETEIETLNLLRKSGSVREFSEGGETKKVSSFDSRKAALEARKASVDFSEVSRRREQGGAKVDSMDFGDSELHAESSILYHEAKKIQAAEGISFEAAVAKARA